MEGKISKLPLDKESKFKEGLGGVPRKERSILCFRKEGGREWKCEKEISFYVWKGVVPKKMMCANKSMEGSCV